MTYPIFPFSMSVQLFQYLASRFGSSVDAGNPNVFFSSMDVEDGGNTDEEDDSDDNSDEDEDLDESDDNGESSDEIKVTKG